MRCVVRADDQPCEAKGIQGEICQHMRRALGRADHAKTLRIEQSRQFVERMFPTDDAKMSGHDQASRRAETYFSGDQRVRWEKGSVASLDVDQV